VTLNVNYDLSMSVGFKIKAARIEKGLTQSEVSEALSVEPATVSRWESGKYDPKPARLQKIAELLQKDVSWFYGGQSKPSHKIEELEQRISELESELKPKLINADFENEQLRLENMALKSLIGPFGRILKILHRQPSLAALFDDQKTDSADSDSDPKNQGTG
jgi:transcriptional regulator with XRE-family HTH domain